MHIFSSLFGKNESIFYYSQNWLRHASEEELKMERERVRRAFGESGKNMKESVRLEHQLKMFDKEEGRRNSKKYVPSDKPLRHREHDYILKD